MPEDRVAELELKFTAQEHLLQELSDVVWKQQRELDAAKARLEQLARRIESQDPCTRVSAIPATSNRTRPAQRPVPSRNSISRLRPARDGTVASDMGHVTRYLMRGRTLNSSLTTLSGSGA